MGWVLPVAQGAANERVRSSNLLLSIGILGDESGRMFEEGDVRNSSDTIRRGFSVLASAVVYM